MENAVNIRNMVDAYLFWKNVDAALGNESLASLARKTSLNYRTLKNQRSLMRVPDLSDSYAIAQQLGVSVEFLVTGKPSSSFIDPRIKVIVDWLQEDERRIDSLEQLVFGEKVGQSSRFSKIEA